jgi:hypothetical protein
MDSLAPNGLPLVFPTGYKVSYRAGASAVPRVLSPQPKQTWSQYLFGPVQNRPFLAFSYADKDSSIGGRVIEADENGNIPNFIPADFDPKGKTYRQLTPDGSLDP